MGWEIWLGIIVFSAVLWWFSFIATKQMRIDKNRERTEMWEKMAAAQKARREQEAKLARETAEQEITPQPTSSQSTSSQSTSAQSTTAEQP